MFPRVWLSCFLCRVSKLCSVEIFNWEYRLYTSCNVQCVIFMWIDCIHWVQKLLYADGLMYLPNLEGVAYFGRYEWKCRTLTFTQSSVCLFYYIFENSDRCKLGSSIQIFKVDKNSDLVCTLKWFKAWLQNFLFGHTNSYPQLMYFWGNKSIGFYRHSCTFQ